MDIKNTARAAIGQGLGMGWGDEAEAWLVSKKTGRPYKEELARIRKEYGTYAQQNPLASTASELIGGMAPLVASYLATAGTEGAAAPTAAATTARTVGALSKLKNVLSSPVAKSIATGATTGAISGAGSATEGNRVKGAASNAVVGAGAGLVIPGAVKGGEAAARWLSTRLAPTAKKVEKAAARKVNKALEESGKKPSDIPKILAKDKELGVPSVVANADSALVDLGETVAQRSGPSARTVEKKLGEQMAGQRERVYSQTRKNLHPGDYYEDEQRLINDLRKNANNLYEEAYSFGTVDDPRINKVLQNPQFKAFYDKAKSIANTEALAAKLSGEDPSKFQLRKIMEVGKDGSIKLTELPDVRTLDYIKRGIDATIDSGFRGQGMSSAEANALKELRKVFTNAIDEATTVDGQSLYRNARKVYSGDMEILQSLRSGMDFNKMDHEEVIKLVSGMSESEKDAFRTGVVRDLYSKIMNPSGNINAAQRIIGSPEMQAKLQPLFDTPAQFNLFKSALEREAQLFQQSGRMLGGSATGRRMQSRERFEDNSEVGQTISDAITGGPFNSLMNLALRFGRKAGTSDEVAEKVAQMLMSSEPAQVAAAVKTLETQGVAQKAAEKVTNAISIGGTGGVTVAAPLPPEGQYGGDVNKENTVVNEKLGPGIESVLTEQEKTPNIPGTSMTPPVNEKLGPGIEFMLNNQ